MKSKLWVFRDINLSQRASLAHALSISPATASLLLARGVTTPDEATTWMSLQAPHDPFLIPDMEQAVERLHRAVTTQEPGIARQWPEKSRERGPTKPAEID